MALLPGDPGRMILGMNAKAEMKPVRAIDGVSFQIPVGTTYGLVGESGCGKTTVGKTIMRV